MLRITLIAFAGLLVLCGSASAKTPVLKGTYVITVRSYCQPELIADYSDSDVVDNMTLSSSGFDQELLKATINSKNGTITGSGFHDSATVLELKNEGPGHSGVGGNPFTETSTSSSGAFSNTATTITFGGQTYSAMYAAIDSTNVAHALSFMGLFTSDKRTCAAQGEATRQ